MRRASAPGHSGQRPELSGGVRTSSRLLMLSSISSRVAMPIGAPREGHVNPAQASSPIV